MKRILTNNSGSVFVLAIMIMLIVFGLAIISITAAYTELTLTTNYKNDKLSFYTSDAGLERSKARFKRVISTLNFRTPLTRDMLDIYASQFESGIGNPDYAGNTDVSFLKAVVPDFEASFLPRKDFTVMEDVLGAGNLYQVSYDFQPIALTRPDTSDPEEKFIFKYKWELVSRGLRRPRTEDVGRTELKYGGNFELAVLQPNFAFFSFFLNSTEIPPSGKPFYFASGDTYTGPVHVNAPTSPPGFSGNPNFYGPFTSSWPSWDTVYKKPGTAAPEQIFHGGYAFGANPIQLPTNQFSQTRVALGNIAGANDTSPVSLTELNTWLNVNNVPNGVYWAKGDGAQANATNELLGGIYVQGDLNYYTMWVSGNDQVYDMGYTRSGKQYHTKFTIDYDTNQVHVIDYNWNGAVLLDKTYTKSPTNPGTIPNPINGSIAVNGEIASASGGLGGATAGVPCIAPDTRVTISAVGDIKLVNDIIYTDDPTDPAMGENGMLAKNILGIFSATGDVYIGTEIAHDPTFHAAIMAGSPGHGFGNSSKSNFKGNITILGGVVNDTSQIVGMMFSGGYKRNYIYDPRFERAYYPPWYPYLSTFLVAFVNNLQYAGDTWQEIYPVIEGGA